MGTKTGIEWTDSTWSALRARVRDDAKQIAEQKGYTSLLPILKPGKTGPHCEHVSQGCTNCYSETNNGRCLPNNGTGLPFDRRSRDLIEPFIDEKILLQPLSWKTSRKVFVCSQTDLFGEWVPDAMIDRVYVMMAYCNQHIFQVLTKRAERMRDYLSAWAAPELSEAMKDRWDVARNHLYMHFWKKGELGEAERVGIMMAHTNWPLRNVWHGVSVEDQAAADERIPLLLQTPAATRFLSCEPLLGPVDLKSIKRPSHNATTDVDWVIAGGESGPGARPMHIRWALNLRDQCDAAGVPFFFKQHGSWLSGCKTQSDVDHGAAQFKSGTYHDFGDDYMALRVGKKRAGAQLAGVEYKHFPEPR